MSEEEGDAAEGPPTSEKQAEANRRIAQDHSTGPKSEDGKRRSSRNAVKHGFHATETYPIPGGLLEEDEVEFRARVEALWVDLHPQNALQAQQAQQVISAYIRLTRLDRYEALGIAGGSKLSPRERRIAGDPEAFEHLATIALDLYFVIEEGHDQTDASYVRITDPDDPTDEGTIVAWETLAKLIRRHGPDPEVGVKGIWTKEREPQTPAEWRKAFKALLRHHWPERTAAAGWAERLAGVFELKAYEGQHVDTSFAVRKVVREVMEPIARLRRSASQELALALATYEELRGGGDPGNEPI